MKSYGLYNLYCTGDSLLPNRLNEIKGRSNISSDKR